jgi:hypothetical protein
MSKGSVSKKKNPTPEKGIRNNEKEEEYFTYPAERFVRGLE